MRTGGRFVPHTTTPGGLNRRIRIVERAAEDAITELMDRGEVPRPSRVKAMVRSQVWGEDDSGEEEPNLLKIFRDRMRLAHWEGDIVASTRDQIRNAIDKFERFLGWACISPSKFDRSLVGDYKIWLYESEGNAPNTVGYALAVDILGEDYEKTLEWAETNSREHDRDQEGGFFYVLSNLSLRHQTSIVFDTLTHMKCPTTDGDAQNDAPTGLLSSMCAGRTKTASTSTPPSRYVRA